MSKIVFIHGVSEKRNARGFSRQLQALVSGALKKKKRALRGSGVKVAEPRMREVVYSDLIDVEATGVIANAVDLVRDVIVYTSSRETREAIQDRFLSVVNPDDVVCAHSLGSIVAIRALLAAARAGRPAPFAALMTMGSPAGLSLSANLLKGAGVGVDWRPLAGHLSAALDVAEAHSWRARWVDFWCDGDCLHTGDFGFLGTHGARGLESVGYPCSSIELDHGSNPITAHSYYWRNPVVGAQLFALWESVREK